MIIKPLALLISLLLSLTASAQIKPLIHTYLGDGHRNYYGNVAPSRLRVKWKKFLGTGFTMVGKERKKWSGAGWTGQPLLIQENGENYLIQPTLSHHLKKIRARDGKLIWSTNLGDVIKGTPTFITTKTRNPEQRYLIISGSRHGYRKNFATDPAYSLHAVSYLTGKIIWQHNVPLTNSNSRDVDASGIMMGNKFCIPTENGRLLFLDPRPSKATPNPKTGIPEPKILKRYPLYHSSDLRLYRHELSCESSPTLYHGTAYTAAGCGRVYAHTGGWAGNGWSLDIGGDLNSSMPLTNDNYLLIGIEKQFISGNGGVMKFSPKRGQRGIQWYFPMPNKHFYEWQGGMIGSPAVNHRTQTNISADLACFVGVDGMLTLINHKKTVPNKTVLGPRRLYRYPTPVVLDQVQLPTGSISTPLFVGNKIIIGYDNGIDLYLVTPNNKLKRLDRLRGPMFDATPIVWNNRIYAASKNGYLYCLGN